MLSFVGFCWPAPGSRKKSATPCFFEIRLVGANPELTKSIPLLLQAPQF
jgi:hypothetical protein